MTRRARVRPPVCLPAAALLSAGLLLFPAAAAAQPADDSAWDPDLVQTAAEWSDEVPAHVSSTTGNSWLERDGTVEADPLNVPLLAGDRLRTEDGYLEILFSDGSLLAFDRHTEAELLSDTLLHLERGAIRLELARGSAGYRIDAAGTTTWARTAGEYLVEIDAASTADRMVRLLVIRGSAELESNAARSLVRAGYEAWASDGRSPSLPRPANISHAGDFARWWDERRHERVGYRSSPYLPSELTLYSGVLDRHGEWHYEAGSGYVWYPRVAAEWTPYSSGRWTYVGVYGWVWIGAERWAWPTHHYGRWGFKRGRYYWIPGRRWAPAWVAWATGPGYVGWVPLGYDDRPLVSIHIGFSTGWRGWTYLPVDRFHTHVVVVRGGRFLPPRHVQLRHVAAVPIRPARIITPRHVVRGPSAPPRSHVAVPRAGFRRPVAASPPSARTAGATPTMRPAAPTTRIEGGTPSAPSRSVAVPRVTNRSTEPAQRPGAVRSSPSRSIAASRQAPPARVGSGAQPQSANRAASPPTRVATPRASAGGPAVAPASRPAPQSRVMSPAAPSRAGARPTSADAPTGSGISRSPARSASPAPGVRTPAPRPRQDSSATPARREPARAVPARPSSAVGATSTAPAVRPGTPAPSRAISRTPARSIERAPAAGPSPARSIDRAPVRTPARAPARTSERSSTPRAGGAAQGGQGRVASAPSPRSSARPASEARGGGSSRSAPSRSSGSRAVPR